MAELRMFEAEAFKGSIRGLGRVFGVFGWGG